ncbi:MAG: DUF6580 family putative transport protein [Chloroherpetonaceae bacterium]
MTEIILVFIGALSRLIPHPANFTAIAAVALFGAVKMKDKKQALLIPIGAMLLSDTIFEVMYRAGVSASAGFHSGMWYVYGAFVVISLIGFWVRSSFSIPRLALGTLIGSLVFFVVTNFGVWLSGWYGYTVEGLSACYIAAIPFYRNQVLGDVFFTAVLFGADYFVKTKVLAQKAA